MKQLLLALFGWYLMTPPVHQLADSRFQIASDALSGWHNHGAFDAAVDCERAAKKKVDDAKGSTFSDPTGPRTGKFVSVLDAMLFSELLARCIATDDPRLAK